MRRRSGGRKERERGGVAFKKKKQGPPLFFQSTFFFPTATPTFPFTTLFCLAHNTHPPFSTPFASKLLPRPSHSWLLISSPFEKRCSMMQFENPIYKKNRSFLKEKKRRSFTEKKKQSLVSSPTLSRPRTPHSLARAPHTLSPALISFLPPSLPLVNSDSPSLDRECAPPL